MKEKNSNLFFESFDKTTKKEWQEKVVTDRKGSPLEDLFWNIEKDIQLEPFYHADDFDKAIEPVSGKGITESFLLGEVIIVDDIMKANAQALESLEGGINAPEFIISRLLSVAELQSLFKGIDLSFITTHFKIIGNNFSVVSFVENFSSFLKKATITKINGSFAFDYSAYSIADIKLIRDKNQLEQFHIFNIETAKNATVSTELATLIYQANSVLEDFHKEGYIIDAIAKRIQFSLFIGKDYFVAIAKLRALKLLWANILKAHGADWKVLPKINISFNPASFDTDENQNMISAATMSLSAIIGGANVLFTGKVDESTTSFNRRIARNVQHILKMESYIDKVADPATGSYYIEKTTEKIADESWKKFQEML